MKVSGRGEGGEIKRAVREIVGNDEIGIATMSYHSVALYRAYHRNWKLPMRRKRSLPAFYVNLTFFYYGQRYEFNQTYSLP